MTYVPGGRPYAPGGMTYVPGGRAPNRAAAGAGGGAGCFAQSAGQLAAVSPAHASQYPLPQLVSDCACAGAASSAAAPTPRARNAPRPRFDVERCMLSLQAGAPGSAPGVIIPRAGGDR